MINQSKLVTNNKLLFILELKNFSTRQKTKSNKHEELFNVHFKVPN